MFLLVPAHLGSKMVNSSSSSTSTSSNSSGSTICSLIVMYLLLVQLHCYGELPIGYFAFMQVGCPLLH